MKKVQSVLTLFLLTAIAAVAQTKTPCAPHPTDPAATFVTSYVVTVEIAQSASVSGKTGKKGTKCTSEQLICVWRTSTGGTDLIGDPASVKFSGTCLTDIPATELFKLLGQAAVEKGVSLGLVPCTGGTKVAARYLTTTCVSRNGSGTTTTYGPCTTVQCVRAYTVSCPAGVGSPVISRAAANNSGCVTTPAGCESGCDQDCPPSDGDSVLMQ